MANPLIELFLSILIARSLFPLMTAATVITSEKQKVVYHVSDAEKVSFALGNIRNHIKGMGGPQNVEIILVVHGPAADVFQEISATAEVRSAVDGLRKDGVEFDMCANIMKAKNIELKDLVPGFIKAENGGVVRIAQLQQQGYVYIRP